MHVIRLITICITSVEHNIIYMLASNSPEAIILWLPIYTDANDVWNVLCINMGPSRDTCVVTAVTLWELRSRQFTFSVLEYALYYSCTYSYILYIIVSVLPLYVVWICNFNVSPDFKWPIVFNILIILSCERVKCYYIFISTIYIGSAFSTNTWLKMFLNNVIRI